MTIAIPDLTSLDLVQFAAFLILVAAIDTAWAIVLAVISKTFSTQVVADFLVTHVLKRVAPIFGLAVFGHGVAALGIPAIGAASVAAVAGLTAYIVETIGSLIANLQTSQAVNAATNGTPAPQPPEPAV